MRLCVQREMATTFSFLFLRTADFRLRHIFTNCVHVRACVFVFLLSHTKTHIYMPRAIQMGCANMHVYMYVSCYIIMCAVSVSFSHVDEH